MITLIRCNKCGELKEISHSGRVICRPCNRETSKLWSQNNPYKNRRKAREWARNNPEKKKQWRAKNTERVRATGRASSKRFRERNPDYYREWRASRKRMS